MHLNEIQYAANVVYNSSTSSSVVSTSNLAPIRSPIPIDERDCDSCSEDERQMAIYLSMKMYLIMIPTMIVVLAYRVLLRVLL